jgi:hypothetical protein
MEQARMGKHALNMNGRGTTSDIDMGSEIGSNAGQDQSCRENRYSQGLASDIQVQGGLLDGQRAAKFRIPATGSVIISELDAQIFDLVASCRFLFAAQPKAPAIVWAGASGWAVNEEINRMQSRQSQFWTVELVASLTSRCDGKLQYHC